MSGRDDQVDLAISSELQHLLGGITDVRPQLTLRITVEPLGVQAT